MNLFVSAFFQPQLSTSQFSNYSLNYFDQHLFISNMTKTHLKNNHLPIKNFLNTHKNNYPILDQFIKKYVEWAINHHFPQAFNDLIALLPAESLKGFAQWKLEQDGSEYKNLYAWAKEQSSHIPQNSHLMQPGQIKTIWKKHRMMAVSFIPNFINIFVGAFNFLDASRRFTSLWDKYLLINIICRFFLLPYLIATALTPFVATAAKAYVLTGVILLSSVAAMTIYYRWFRPCPEDIVNCKNLDKRMDFGLIHPVVGQQKTCETLISHLLGGSNVLIVGKSGEGKTALMNQLVQRKKNQQLPHELQKLKNQELDCGLLMSNVSFGHSELINQTKEQIEGFENDILLFVDEIHHLTGQPAAFNAFQKRFMEDKPCPLFVATTTYEGYKKIQELDEDQSFERRVSVIVLEGNSDEQIRRILVNYGQEEANDIFITNEAIQRIAQLSSSQSFLNKVARPAKALKILKDAVGRCRATLATPNQFDKIKRMIQSYNFFKKELVQLHYQFSKLCSASRQVTLPIEKRYLLYNFYVVQLYPQFISREIEKVSQHTPVQVTAKLVNQVFQDLQKTERLLNKFAS